jgi:hypothetical protein
VKPIDTNKTAAGKAHNRRAEINKRINFLKYLWKTPLSGRFIFMK